MKKRSFDETKNMKINDFFKPKNDKMDIITISPDKPTKKQKIETEKTTPINKPFKMPYKEGTVYFENYKPKITQPIKKDSSELKRIITKTLPITQTTWNTQTFSKDYLDYSNKPKKEEYSYDLSEEQQHVLDMVLDGESIFFTGSKNNLQRFCWNRKIIFNESILKI
jgi:hypothetical protein